MQRSREIYLKILKYSPRNNEALKYLGKYPATKKKISEILEKRLKNKKTYQKVIFPEDEQRLH